MKEPWVDVIDADASLFFKQMPPKLLMVEEAESKTIIAT